MGMCQPSGGFDKRIRPKGRSIEETTDQPPNSRLDLYNEEGGAIVQQRWFDAIGRAIWDRDFSHGNSHNNHEFPHDHKWDWSKKIPRQKDNLEPDLYNYC